MDRKRGSWILWNITAIAVFAILGSVFAPRGMAQERGGRWEGGGRGGWRGPEMRGHWGHGDIRYFQERDLDRWRGGHWFHGDHFGRLGWWWVLDDAWFFYPVPVYPYPNPYIPPAIVTQAPPSPQYWYYCESVKESYPYVTNCPEGWKQVVPEPAPSQ